MKTSEFYKLIQQYPHKRVANYESKYVWEYMDFSQCKNDQQLIWKAIADKHPDLIITPQGDKGKWAKINGDTFYNVVRWLKDNKYVPELIGTPLNDKVKKVVSADNEELFYSVLIGMWDWNWKTSFGDVKSLKKELNFFHKFMPATMFLQDDNFPRRPIHPHDIDFKNIDFSKYEGELFKKARERIYLGATKTPPEFCLKLWKQEKNQELIDYINVDRAYLPAGKEYHWD